MHWQRIHVVTQLAMLKTACAAQNSAVRDIRVDSATHLALCNASAPTYSRLISQNYPSAKVQLKPTVPVYCK